MSRVIIKNNQLQLEIDTLGARIIKLTNDGQELMRSAKDELQGYNGMVLAPWPNRIKDGQYSFEGNDYQLEINEPERNNALHGFAYKTPFQITQQTESKLTLTAQLGPITGYPFQIELEISYELVDSGFVCNVRAVNKSASVAPFGIAFHPYFPVNDQTRISIPAKTHIQTNQQMIPTGSKPNTQQSFVFAEVDFDDCFSELSRTNGIAEITIDSNQQKITLWQDQAFDYVMVYTTNEFDAVNGSAKAIAIEAQSCLANAFNDDPPVLKPEESFIGSWGLTSSV